MNNPKKRDTTPRGGRARATAGTRQAPLAAVDTRAVASSEALVRRIYQSVFDSVMGRRLPPGTKLPEAALCELFGVGRTTVQKALQKLAHDHIVELRPNSGAVVAMPTPEEINAIFEARRALETAIVALAARNAGKRDITQLRRQLQEEHAAMHSYRQAEWAPLASSFHLQIAELCGNPILLRYLQELLSRSSLIVALHEPAGHAECEHGEHTRIADAIERGDAAAAIDAMNAHLLVLEQRIRLVSGKADHKLANMLGLA